MPLLEQQKKKNHRVHSKMKSGLAALWTPYCSHNGCAVLLWAAPFPTSLAWKELIAQWYPFAALSFKTASTQHICPFLRTHCWCHLKEGSFKSQAVSFLYSFVPQFVHLFIHSFVHSFIHSFFCSSPNAYLASAFCKALCWVLEL